MKERTCLSLPSSKPPQARPPGHGRPGGNRWSAEGSPSPLDRASEKGKTLDDSKDLMFKAALTPRCFQRTAPKPRSHPKPKKGARVWRTARAAARQTRGGRGVPGAETGGVKRCGGWAKGAGCGRMGAGRAGGGRMFPARRRRPPAAPRSRAEVSPRRRSLKGSRTPRRPSAGGRSGAGASAAASPAPPPGPPSAPRPAGKAPGAMALPGSHAAWDGAAASVSNSC